MNWNPTDHITMIFMTEENPGDKVRDELLRISTADKKPSYFLPKNKVEEFYANVFDPTELLNVISPTDFNRREIGWVAYPETDNPSDKKIFVRNKRFASIEEFRRFHYEPGVLENIMAKTAANLFGIMI